MSTKAEFGEQRNAGADRRELLKKAAVGGAIVWAAPSVMTRAALAAGSTTPFSGIVVVRVGLLGQTATCDDPNDISLSVETEVTPDLVGKNLRMVFTFGGPGDASPFNTCDYAIPLPTSSTTTGYGFRITGADTLEYGVTVSVTNDCVDTIATYTTVPGPCGPLPGAGGGTPGGSSSAATPRVTPL